MKTQKFTYPFLAVVFYTALLCRNTIHYFFELIADYSSSDESNIATSIGVMLLLTGIIVYFFSQRTGWVLFAIYGSYLAFDNLIAFFYALQGEIRGDYLYDPVYTWLHYLGLYFLFSGLAIAALYFMYRFLEYQFNFQKKNWVFILSAGLVLALVYTYLFAEAWAHPN